MPHKCTKCGHVFDDGSSSVFTGCPTCGGNKFLYVKFDKNAHPLRDDSSAQTAHVSADTPLKEHTAIPVDHQGTKVDPSRVESIRILGPGSYEINIPALIQRKEIVMALKEDGNYVIHMDSAFNKKRAKLQSKEKEDS
ncbi:MAG: Zn-ribbon domain-containing protein [Halobacteriota archaeon]